MRVIGEMARDPVKDHSNTDLMQPIDQMTKILRRSKAAGWGIVPGHLIPPRRI